MADGVALESPSDLVRNEERRPRCDTGRISVRNWKRAPDSSPIVLGRIRLHDEPQNKEINRLVGILGDSCGNRVRSLVDVYKISLTLLVLVS